MAFVGAPIAYLSADKPSALFVAFVVAAAILAAAIPVLEWHRERAVTAEEVRDSMHPPVPVEEVDPYLRLGIERSVREKREDGGRPPYIERPRYDAALDAALQQHNFALLITPSSWGKSRSL